MLKTNQTNMYHIQFNCRVTSGTVAASNFPDIGFVRDGTSCGTNLVLTWSNYNPIKSARSIGSNFNSHPFFNNSDLYQQDVQQHLSVYRPIQVPQQQRGSRLFRSRGMYLLFFMRNIQITILQRSNENPYFSKQKCFAIVAFHLDIVIEQLNDCQILLLQAIKYGLVSATSISSYALVEFYQLR